MRDGEEETANPRPGGLSPALLWTLAFLALFLAGLLFLLSIIAAGFRHGRQQTNLEPTHPSGQIEIVTTLAAVHSWTAFLLDRSEGSAELFQQGRPQGNGLSPAQAALLEAAPHVVVYGWKEEAAVFDLFGENTERLIFAGESRETENYDWLNPHQVREDIARLQTALAAAYPEEENEIASRGEELREQLEELESRFQSLFDSVQTMPVILAESELRPFADSLGLETTATLKLEHGEAGVLLLDAETSERLADFEKQALILSTRQIVPLASVSWEERRPPQVVVVDPIISGAAESDSYMKRMERNALLIASKMQSTLAATRAAEP